jgi:thioredoxin reductase (NADPH)
MLTTEIENFPGVNSDVTGPELMERMMHQARYFGADVWQTDCEHIDFSSRPFRVRVHNCTVEADAVVLASGADALWLGAGNEEKFRGRGLSTCATCDGFLYRNRSVVVVGGGDSALEEAMHLARLASDVTIIHRRSELRASKVKLLFALKFGVSYL